MRNDYKLCRKYLLIFLSILIIFALVLIRNGFTEAEQERDHLPGKINLVPEFQELGLAPRAQKPRDTCSLFAITALADFEYARSTSRPHKRLSEEFLIWAANEATGLKGDPAMFYEAVHGLNALGICTEELMPYSDTTDAKRKPSSAALADAKVRSGRWQVQWIRRWDLKCPLSDTEVLAIKNALAQGHPGGMRTALAESQGA